MPDVAGRTLQVGDLGVPPTPFDLIQSQEPAPRASGRAAAQVFLAIGDFEPYKARSRSGAPEVRRQPGLARPSTDQVAE
jgi:hypothetical protein